MATKGTTANKKEDKFKDLIGPKDEKLDGKVREKLITARVGLLLKASFFGNLATRLKLINADEWCPTAATDGRNFYYNSRFIQMLRPKEIEFLFGHEVLHCVYDHFGRRGDRDPQIWNIANDFCVNADLVKHKVGELITTVPALYDTKYDGMSSEEVFDDLMKNAKKINMSDLIDKMIDEHLDGEGDAEGDGDGEGNGKGRPKLSEEDRRAIRDEIKEAMKGDGKTRFFGKTKDEIQAHRAAVNAAFARKKESSSSDDKPNIASRTDFSDEKMSPKFKAPKKMAKEKVETSPGDMGSVDRTADVIGPDMSTVNKEAVKPTRDFTATEMAQNLMSPGYNKMKKGGAVKAKKMASGGKTSQLAKANGIAVRGKTKGKMC
jgi:hypothetical protein